MQPQDLIRLVSMPSSYSALPPLDLPDRREIERVENLKRSLLREHGIHPGTYATIEPVMFGPIAGVYDGLQTELLKQIAVADAFDLCIRLYERDEEYLGLLLRSHDDRAMRRAVAGIPESPMASERMWEWLSPYKEAIRWLIEIVVKVGGTAGSRVSDRELDRLIVLANAVLEWDYIWEHIYRAVVPHELLVEADYSLVPRQTPVAQRALVAYRNAIMPAMTQAENEQFQLWQSKRRYARPGDEDGDLRWLEKMGLDDALLDARGYSLTDWGRFVYGLINSFEEREYRKVIKIEALSRFLADKWALSPEPFHNLLRDFGLSKQTVNDFELDKLRPAEHGRRDSRLLRRPVVVLEHGGSLRCLYGIETFQAGQILMFDRIESGRAEFIRDIDDRQLRSAIGGSQKEKGSKFEEHIADRCKSMNLEYYREKGKIAGKGLPQGKGFGPVDVFIVDRAHHRFVLVEAKNYFFDISIPKEMKKDRDEFAECIKTLNAQVDWFTNGLDDLKNEYGIPAHEQWSVEGVIVVSALQPWMILYEDPVPILDFKNFFMRISKPSNFIIHHGQ